ncbi:MAG: carbohydrate kinase family protein [Promethearchaeota archaeon]
MKNSAGFNNHKLLDSWFPVKPLDLVLFGHFALDKVIYRDEVSETLGGGVTYGSATARAFDPEKRIGIVSVAGEDFKPEYKEFLDELGVDTRGVRTVEGPSTHYLLKYHALGRDLCLGARAPDLDIAQVPDDYFQAKALMLGPICNEIPLEFVRGLNSRVEGGRVGVDVQGFIRHFGPSGVVSLKDGQAPIDLVYDLIDLLGEKLVFKASDYEAEAITGKGDPYESIRDLSRNGAVIVVTRGEKGSLILKGGGEVIKVPAFKPRRIEDETGAGDAYMSGFLLELGDKEATRENLEWAGVVGSAVASFLLEEKGPWGAAHRTRVLERVGNHVYVKFREKDGSRWTDEPINT